jgi:8-oxo-dGTP pyrophosphatase MutT (NUDIX family)
VAGTLHKVTAFVTRTRSGGGQELLVMQHPTAGVQVPAGTVEENEPVADAVVRELAEETGLVDVRLVRRLGSEVLPPGHPARATIRAAPLRKGPSVTAAILDPAFPRAHWFRVASLVGEFSEIVYEVLDLNAKPERVLERYSAWVESDAIADIVERHFFHFESLVPTQERWVQQAEQRFECYWTPLVPKPQLVSVQDTWLDAVYGALLAPSGGGGDQG